MVIFFRNVLEELTSSCSLNVLFCLLYGGYLKGEPLVDVNELYRENNETVIFVWHPTKKHLTVGLNSGDIQLWNGQPDFINISSPHQAPIKILKWSELGTRLISLDEVSNICSDSSLITLYLLF